LKKNIQHKWRGIKST